MLYRLNSLQVFHHPTNSLVKKRHRIEILMASSTASYPISWPQDETSKATKPINKKSTTQRAARRMASPRGGTIHPDDHGSQPSSTRHQGAKPTGNMMYKQQSNPSPPQNAADGRSTGMKAWYAACICLPHRHTKTVAAPAHGSVSVGCWMNLIHAAAHPGPSSTLAHSLKSLSDLPRPTDHLSKLSNTPNSN